MSNIEERISENAKRIGTLETDVGKMKVDMAKLAVTVEHESTKQTERYQNISTQTIELKDLMKERMRLDEEREQEHRRYRAERERLEEENKLERQKWLQSLFTPQTVIIVVVIILSALGISISDLPMSTLVGVETVPTKAEPQP